MLGLVIAAQLLAAAPPKAAPPAKPSAPPKTSRPMTAEEEEAEAMKVWESKAAKELPMFDAGSLGPAFKWKLSNVMREIPVDGIQMVNDTPVKLHGVVVKGRLADVLEEIYKHFVQSGLYVQPLNQQDQMFRQVQITALDGFRAISYTAMVDALPDGTCTVMLGEANIGESTRTSLYRKMHNLPDQDFAPMMPNAISPTRVRIEGMKTLSFQVSASQADAQKFYEQELKKLGYVAGGNDFFQRDTDEIQITYHRDGPRLGVLLTLRLKAKADPTALPHP